MPAKGIKKILIFHNDKHEIITNKGMHVYNTHKKKT